MAGRPLTGERRFFIDWLRACRPTHRRRRCRPARGGDAPRNGPALGFRRPVQSRVGRQGVRRPVFWAKQSVRTEPDPGAPSWARSSSWSYRACSSADAERFETQRAPRFHFEVAAVRAQRVKALIACLLSMHLVKKNHRGDDRVPRCDVSSVSGSGRRPRESNRWFQRASLSLLVKSQEG